MTRTTGILVVLALLATILEIYAYQACFIGPLMAFMAILQHLNKKRKIGE